MRNFLFSAATWILIAAGSFVALCGALDYWESKNAQAVFAREWQQDTGNIAPGGESNKQAAVKQQITLTPAPRRGNAVAKLVIPRLDSVLYVVEGTDDRDLKRGPGHVTGTVLPGEDGNCVIAGHRDTHFNVLKQIRDGDEIILERSGHQFRYKVDSLSVVSPDNTASLQPAGKPVLNLITCYPFNYVGSAPRRFIVHADLEQHSAGAS